jgi:predicted PurR-regulated permease PerM
MLLLMPNPEPRGHVVHSRFYARTFGLVVAVTVGYLLFRIIQPFLIQVTWAGLLAAILHPLHVRLTRLLKNRPTASSSLIAFGGALVILIPSAALGTLFTQQAAHLLERIRVAAAQRHMEGLSDVLALPGVKLVLERLHTLGGVQVDQVIDYATTGAERALQFLLQTSGKVFVGALGAVGNFFFEVFFLFFFLRDGAKTMNTLAHFIPMPSARRSELAQTLSGTARAVVLGTLLTALIQGTLVAVGFAISGLPSAIVFGVLATICSPIPFVGTTLIWGPAAAVLFFQGQAGWGIFMIGWGVLVVSMADNIVRPLLISGRSGVPTLLVFVGVLGGLSSFGGVGMFIGPLILALLVALIRYGDELLRDPHRDGSRETITGEARIATAVMAAVKTASETPPAPAPTAPASPPASSVPPAPSEAPPAQK